MTLAIELLVGPDADTNTWTRAFETLFAWRAALVPRELKRLSDPGAPRREPWQESRRSELARRITEEVRLAWTVVCASASVLVHREPAFVKIAALIKESAESSASELIDLLGALETVLAPSLAMAFDPDMESDGELTLERLADVPPVFYIGRDVIDLLGGRTRLHAAPAITRDVAGGIVFEVARSELEAMRTFLRISTGSPLAAFGDRG